VVSYLMIFLADDCEYGAGLRRAFLSMNDPVVYCHSVGFAVSCRRRWDCVVMSRAGVVD
jgi:hypothetical protein